MKKYIVFGVLLSGFSLYGITDEDRQMLDKDHKAVEEMKARIIKERERCKNGEQVMSHDYSGRSLYHVVMMSTNDINSLTIRSLYYGDDYTPLQEIASEKWVVSDGRVVYYMLSQKPDLSVVSAKGKTVKVIAEEANNEMMLKYLALYQEAPELFNAKQLLAPGEKLDDGDGTSSGGIFSYFTARNSLFAGILVVAGLAWHKYVGQTKDAKAAK